MMKRLMVFTLILMLVSSSFGVFAAQEGKGGPPDISSRGKSGTRAFLDLETVAWGQNEAEEMASSGKLLGYEDHSFRPNNAVTHLEAITMIVRMMGWEDETYPATSKFDLDEIPEWGHPYVLIAESMGVFDETDAFEASSPATRQEVANYVVNAYGDNLPELKSPEGLAMRYTDDDLISEKYQVAVYQMKELGLMIGDHSARFNPTSSVRRIEMAMIMHRHCNTYRLRNLTGEEDNLRVSLLIDDETSRFNVAVDPAITAHFSKEVFYETPGDTFNATEVQEVLLFTEVEGDEIDYSVAIDDDLWTITPETLDYDTDYALIFDGEKIVDDEGQKLTEQTAFYFTTMEEPEYDELTLISVDPSDAQEDVPLDTEVVFTFSEPVKDEEGTLVLDSTVMETIEVYVKSGPDWEIVPQEDYEVDVNDEVWTLVFDEALEYNTLYRTGLKTDEIAAFLGESTFEFKTVGLSNLTFSPEGEEVAVDEPITLEFDTAVKDLEGDPFNVTDIAGFVTLEMNGDDVTYVAELLYDTDSTTITLVVGDYLTYGATYEITVDEDEILDGVEGALTHEFTVGEAPLEVSFNYPEEISLGLEEELLLDSLESITLLLDEDLDGFYDATGDALDNTTALDHVTLVKTGDETFTYNLDLSANTITLSSFDLLEAGEYVLTLEDIYYDAADLKLYLEETPLNFAFELID